MENTFGEFLKKKRQEKSLTQQGLAKKLFVSESSVSKWEKNIAHPDITLLPKLAQILDVTEHELITASIDNQTREEKKQAKKWRIVSSTWDLFFYISYIVALVPCFICDLAINKSLTWFWIVLSSLILAFTFTNLPKLIKKHKLILVPLSMYLALCLLLAVCCIYSSGNWFWISSLPVLFGLVSIFMPIYISKYKFFARIRKYNDFVSLGIDFLLLNVLLIVINVYTNKHTSHSLWYVKIALPIIAIVYLILNILLCVRFLKTNGFIKSSLILFLISVFIYAIPPFIKVKNENLQKEIDDINIFKSNLSCWKPDVMLENNIHLIICLTILALSLCLLICGIIKSKRKLKK